ITFAGGAVHEGVFQNNNLNECKLTFPDREVHEGVFRVNNDVSICLHGPGKITFGGCEIEGKFAHGKLVQGMITNSKLENGGTYTGQVSRIPSEVDGRNGFVPNGTGKKTSNGIVEEGVFVDNYLREGKATDHDGEVHEGVFDVDGLHEGKITFADEEVHERVFGVGGLREGKIIFPGEGKNGEVKKEGVFVDCLLNGMARLPLLMDTSGAEPPSLYRRRPPRRRATRRRTGRPVLRQRQGLRRGRSGGRDNNDTTDSAAAGSRGPAAGRSGAGEAPPTSSSSSSQPSTASLAATDRDDWRAALAGGGTARGPGQNDGGEGGGHELSRLIFLAGGRMSKAAARVHLEKRLKRRPVESNACIILNDSFKFR
ncbi:hypothetical protein THAOC_30802, partial [Thalassiosira oceanica]